MPERLSIATAATCAALAAAVFGGAYALAHDSPAKPAAAPALPTAIRLQADPIGALHRVNPLPALIVPPPRPEPAQPEPTQPEPVVEDPAPVVAPTPVTPQPPAPSPEPAPKPKPPAAAKPPLTFDDSG